METIQPLTICFPGKLIFGNGKIEQLKDEVLAFTTKKVLIITIEPLLPMAESIVKQLKAAYLEVQIDSTTDKEPYFSDFKNMIRRVGRLNPDVVIGIGGGSVLDLAKLVAAQLDNRQTLEEYVGMGLLHGRKKALICVPTTSGTGSEASPNAILVDDSDGQKKGIISQYLVPDVVIVEFRYGLFDDELVIVVVVSHQDVNRFSGH